MNFTFLFKWCPTKKHFLAGPLLQFYSHEMVISLPQPIRGLAYMYCHVGSYCQPDWVETSYALALTARACTWHLSYPSIYPCCQHHYCVAISYIFISRSKPKSQCQCFFWNIFHNNKLFDWHDWWVLICPSSSNNISLVTANLSIKEVQHDCKEKI